jgi:nucleotide-binding universal stress UspA family protein
LLAKILLPVDFSDRCIGVAHYAAQFAGHFNSEITLLHALAPVAPPPHEYPELYVGMAPGDSPAARYTQAQHRLDGYLEAELDNLRVVRVLEEGDPASRIIEHAQSGGFDLIMMPTHGYGPFRRLLLGSVTAKVLHGADCPVWTSVHGETSPPAEAASLKHIVCAVDLGPHSAAVLGWASSMATEFKARLTVVHVVALDPRTQAYYFSPEWRWQLIKSAKADVEKLQARAGSNAEIQIDAGDIHQAVRGAAVSLQADLLVIGRSAASGIFGRLPSHAYAIIRDSPCPVVSV